MKEKIVCYLAIFDTNQQIYLTTNNGCEHIATATLTELPSVLASLCKQYDVNNIYLTGNKKFGKAMCEDILWYSEQRYHMNNIEIEVE